MTTKRRSTTNTSAKKVVRGFMRGSEGRANVDVELKKSAARKEKRDKEMNKPFRFRMKDGEEGREIVLLDDAPDFFMYEHTLQDPVTGWHNNFVTCCQVFTDCAICQSTMDGHNASYNMVFTCLDLQSYTTKKGETVPYSRKLYMVKQGQHKKFMRLYEKKGTLRGARFVLARDGDKSPAIGSDIEFDGFMEEAELQEYVREYTDREGKKHVEDCSEPFVYEDVFDAPDPQAIRDMVPGSSPPPGSREANEEEPVRAKKHRKDEEEEEFEEDDGADAAWEEEEEDEVEAEEEAEEEEEVEEEPAPKRKPRRASSANKKPAPRKARRATRH